MFCDDFSDDSKMRSYENRLCFILFCNDFIITYNYEITAHKILHLRLNEEFIPVDIDYGKRFSVCTKAGVTFPKKSRIPENRKFLMYFIVLR